MWWEHWWSCAGLVSWVVMWVAFAAILVKGF